MRLSTLLAALPAELAPRAASAPAADPVIRGIGYDSRRVAPGDLFVALRGSHADGHGFVPQAVRLGAAALLVEEVPAGLDPEAPPAVAVPDTRRALAPLAVRYFGDPSAELTLVGVTGTNGKTSTTYLIESILAAAGRRTGLAGTVEVRYGPERRRAINTTPESLDVQQALRGMCTHGVDVAVMEVSSHGLALGRVDGCRFAVAALTNVTPEHLDFHLSMDAYRDSKARLFQRYLTPGGAAVVNADDPAAEQFAAAARERGARVLRVSRGPREGADVALTEACAGIDGSRVRARVPSGELDLELPLLGELNLENLAVALGAAWALGVPEDAVARGVAACPQVPGRLERVSGRSGGPAVLVDYAHTPDAVEKLLRSVRPLARGRLITVFGCGGDRDRAKRPAMARAAARWSDRVVATSDNPRREDPLAILAELEPGLASLRRVDPEKLDAAEGTYAVVPDRREAIALAVGIARRGDTVVLAGKGHEDYQIVGGERRPFDDRVEARRALRARGDA